MFRCDNCNQIFEDPQESWEKMGEHHGQPAWEPVQMCPFCGGEFKKMDNPARVVEGLIRIKDQYDLLIEDRETINAACNMLEEL